MKPGSPARAIALRCEGFRGFTLIDLMISVAVVAIVAAIAIPSYSAYVKRAQRAAAKAALQQAAQFLERNYTISGCYDFADVASCTARAGNAVILSVTSSPNDGPATYAIASAFAPPAGFVAGQYFLLSAAPCGTSATACGPGSNTTFTDPSCGALQLDNTGQQLVDPSGSGTGAGFNMQANAPLVTNCWQH